MWTVAYKGTDGGTYDFPLIRMLGLTCSETVSSMLGTSRNLLALSSLKLLFGKVIIEAAGYAFHIALKPGASH